MSVEVKTETPETVDGEVVTTAVAVPQASMEFRLINPTEKGFLKKIEWNKAELEAAVRQKIADYEGVVYTEENMQQAKNDRAELNKLTKAIEDRRKVVKRIINEPYETFEAELKEILELIQEPVAIIDKQVKAFEDKQKEEKKKAIKVTYDEVIGDLVEVLPFEKVFDDRYLNKTYKLATAQSEVKAKVEKVRTDLETIDSLESKFKLNAKDVYIKTLDLSKALAENKRLADLEEKLEAEKRRKAEEERKAQEAAIKQQESVTETPENVIKEGESVSNSPESVSIPEENVTEPVTPMGRTIQSIEQQAFAAAVDPFAPKQEEVKRFRTKFCAVGTREQLEKLIQFMNENGIEYGRIK